MTKKAKQMLNTQDLQKNNEDIKPEVEKIYKMILRVMSWIVGIAFVALILLPEINFNGVDLTVKIVYYTLFANLFLFVIIELFGKKLKITLNKYF